MTMTRRASGFRADVILCVETSYEKIDMRCHQCKSWWDCALTSWPVIILMVFPARTTSLSVFKKPGSRLFVLLKRRGVNVFHVRLDVAHLIICIPYIMGDAILDSSTVLLKSKRLCFSLFLWCTPRAGLWGRWSRRVCQRWTWDPRHFMQFPVCQKWRGWRQGARNHNLM